MSTPGKLDGLAHKAYQLKSLLILAEHLSDEETFEHERADLLALAREAATDLAAALDLADLEGNAPPCAA